MSQEDRRANFIIRNADQYELDPVFRKMVDNTVYLTEDQKHESQRSETEKFGTTTRNPSWL